MLYVKILYRFFFPLPLSTDALTSGSAAFATSFSLSAWARACASSRTISFCAPSPLPCPPTNLFLFFLLRLVYDLWLRGSHLCIRHAWQRKYNKYESVSISAVHEYSTVGHSHPCYAPPTSPGRASLASRDQTFRTLAVLSSRLLVCELVSSTASSSWEQWWWWSSPWCRTLTCPLLVLVRQWSPLRQTGGASAPVLPLEESRAPPAGTHPPDWLSGESNGIYRTLAYSRFRHTSYITHAGQSPHPTCGKLLVNLSASSILQ